jgi:hypothetical protein
MVGRAVVRPKLLVLVVLEQMRQDYLDRILGRLDTGGLRRAVYRGAHFPDCRHLASTFPATSVATLSTGAWPSQHGIVADRWFDRAARVPVRASGELLLATTLCAQAAVTAGVKAYAIGMDSTQTGLVAGNAEVRQFWMDARGQFTTLGNPPAWFVDLNRLEPIENKHNAPWSSTAARKGAPPLRTLTYDAERPQEFVNLYKASPLSEETQFGLAARLIEEEKLGTRDTTDFVCVISGSSALLGYETGGGESTDSPLMREMMLALDRHVHFLMGRLDGAVGENGYNLVLVGGHGAAPVPPDAARTRMAVKGESVAQTVDKALQATGTGRVTRYLYPFLYLDTSGMRSPSESREVAGRAALTHPAVAGFYTADGYCSEHDAWASRFGNSFHAQRSGDVMLSYRPEYVEDFGVQRGISYGSLYNYDVRVPLSFYGPSFRPGAYEAPVESVDVAPTLARVLGVSAPSSSVGRVLGEAFGE